MGRRGFFAELQHQSRLASRERERAARDAARRHAAAVREMDRADKAAERARSLYAKASEAERKRLEREAKDAHLVRMEAEVAEKNAALEDLAEEVGSLLACTLVVDDYVDLAALKRRAVHKPFVRPDLEALTPRAADIPLPAEPVLTLPDAPTGLASFFGKKRHEEAVAAAKAAHEADVIAWRAEARSVLMKRKLADEEWNRTEAARVEALRSARESYDKECSAHEAEVAQVNRRLDELTTNLAYGVADAAQEYVSIVLANSAYPDCFQVAHEPSFDPSTAELTLNAVIPAPGTLSEIKSYKYAKSSDEIVSTPMSQKDIRDRYASAVHQVALRSFHEVFESDRRGLIKTIALEVGTNTIDPATGQEAYVPFVIAAAERGAFLALNLSAVVPALTLEHLGAAVSKNPYGLVPAKRAGVRKA